MELPNTLKNLFKWLNTYAFIGWNLERGKYSLDQLIEIAEQDDERFESLLEEFHIATLKAMIKQEDEDR